MNSRTLDTTNIIKLRKITGAGMSDCKHALYETKGDIDKAIEFLRKRGAVKAAKKIAERTTQQGIIESYIHANGKVGVLVELRCETDFVAKTDEFQQLAHDIAMQIAAAQPLYLRPETIPLTVIQKEKEIYTEQLKKEGKSDTMIEKILTGKLKKYYQEVCLLNQPFIKDETTTIQELVNQKITKIGEKIEIAHFIRYQI